MRNRSIRSGFTLVEVLVVLTLAAVVIVFGVWAYHSSNAEPAEKLYERTAGLMSAIKASGRNPQSDTELAVYGAMAEGFRIYRDGENQQFVYLEHAKPADFSAERLAGMATTTDATYRVYLGLIGAAAGVLDGKCLYRSSASGVAFGEINTDGTVRFISNVTGNIMPSTSGMSYSVYVHILSGQLRQQPDGSLIAVVNTLQGHTEDRLRSTPAAFTYASFFYVSNNNGVSWQGTPPPYYGGTGIQDATSPIIGF